MNQSDLFVAPKHHVLADLAAIQIKLEIHDMVVRALAEFDQRAKQILAFHNRSIAQRRRFWRLRTALEGKKA